MYYLAITFIFNFGWATIETSHLAMIPELSPSEDARTGLSVIRNSMIAVSNIVTYFIAFIVFSCGKLIIITFIVFKVNVAYDI